MHPQTPDNTPPQADHDAPPAAPPAPVKPRSAFGKFFVRGLATLLPAVLTIWLVIFVYGFMRDRVAAPINSGVKIATLRLTDWPAPAEDDFGFLFQPNDDPTYQLSPTLLEAWEIKDDALKQELGEEVYNAARKQQERRAWAADQPETRYLARMHQLDLRWNSVTIGSWHPLDLIGLIVAVVLFYFAGVLMSNIVGRRLKDKGESLLNRVPLVRRVYPAVKQVTDFFFSHDDKTAKFNRVVAVEYPRKGLWSVGLVTGPTMKMIQERVGEQCLTVFIPSSPTPFTGYVITVPVTETIDLDISIEEALKFAVSGGVLIPPAQRIAGDTGGLFQNTPGTAAPETATARTVTHEATTPGSAAADQDSPDSSP